MDKDAVTIVRSAFSTQVFSPISRLCLIFYSSNFVRLNLTLSQTDNLGPAKKKKKVGTPRVVSGRRHPHASYAPAVSGVAKSRHLEKPKLWLKRIETAGQYATVHIAALLWLALRLKFESRSSLLGNTTENELLASGKFCLISDRPLSLSLSLHDQIRKKKSYPLNKTIRTSKRKFAIRSRSPWLTQLAVNAELSLRCWAAF